VDSGQGVSNPESRAIRLLATRSFTPSNDRALAFNLPIVRWLKSNREIIQERGDGWLYVATGPFKSIPEQTKLSGMARANDRFENVQAYFQLSSSVENPIAYRFRSASTAVRWESPLVLIPQIVAGVSDTDVTIQPNGWSMQRRWRLEVQGPALDELKFRIPLPDPIESDGPNISDDPSESDGLKWELRVNGMAVPVSTQRIPADLQSYRVRANLVEAIQKATIELSCSYSDGNKTESIAVGSEAKELATNRQGESRSKAYAIPIAKLSINGDSSVQDNPAIITPREGVLCEINAENGTTKRFTSYDGPFSKRLFESDSFLKLTSVDIKALASPEVTIEQMWLQTLTNDSQVRQRVVFKARTKARTLVFRLPPQWESKNLKVIVNGFESELPSPTTEGYRCALASNDVSESGIYVVEFWNWYDEGTNFSRLLKPHVPDIQGASINVSCTWQIAVPVEDVLWSIPTGWLGDWNWSFIDLGFRRIATQQQVDFERALGATRQPPLPQSTNRYVVSSIITPQSRTEIASILVIPRYWLWLLVGSTLLLLSILWSIVSWFRKPIVVTTELVTLILAAMIVPDIAILICQTAVVSLIVVGIVATFQWAWPIRTKRRDASHLPSKSSPSAVINGTVSSVVTTGHGSRSGSRPTELSPAEPLIENKKVVASPKINNSADFPPPLEALPEILAASTRTNIRSFDSNGSEPQK